MSNGDDKLVRVRGGAKGFRQISLGAWKNEIKAKRGKGLPQAKSRQAVRMEAKLNRRNRKPKKVKS